MAQPCLHLYPNYPFQTSPLNPIALGIKLLRVNSSLHTRLQQKTKSEAFRVESLLVSSSPLDADPELPCSHRHYQGPNYGFPHPQVGMGRTERSSLAEETLEDCEVAEDQPM